MSIRNLAKGAVILTSASVITRLIGFFYRIFMSSTIGAEGMGLYQMAPSRPDFATSLPLFNKMTVKLANGNVLKIDKSKYDLTKMSGSVSYFDVMRGGELSEITKKKE